MHFKIIRLFLIIYIQCVFEVWSKIEHIQPHLRNENCASCISDIVRSSFRTGSLIAVVLPAASDGNEMICDKHRTNLADVLRETRWSFLIRNANLTSYDLNVNFINPVGNIENYILFVSDSHDVDAALRSVRRSVTWNAYAKFLIVVDAVGGEWQALLLYIVQEFWRQFAIDIVVHVTDDEGNIKVSSCHLNSGQLIMPSFSFSRGCRMKWPTVANIRIAISKWLLVEIPKLYQPMLMFSQRRCVSVAYQTIV